MPCKFDGGTAFPRTGFWSGRDGPEEVDTVPERGMSLRDWFAGMALPSVAHAWAEGDATHAAAVAKQCYLFADAMIDERERQ